MRLTKVLRFSDRFELDLNFEAFNAFNHSTGTAVNTVAFEANALTLKPVAHLGETVASQGYPDGTNARRAQVGVRLLW